MRIQFDKPLNSEQTQIISPQDQETQHFSTSEALPSYFCFDGPPRRVTVVSQLKKLIQINFSCLWTSRKWNHMYAFFCVWLLPLNTKFVRFIHVVEILICSQCCIVFCCMTITQFLYLFNFDRRFGCFQFGDLWTVSLKHSSMCLSVNRYTFL